MGALELDDLYLRLGLCGWFPLGIFCALLVEGMASCFLFFGNSLATLAPPFWCDDERLYDDILGAEGNFNVTRVLESLTPKQVCSRGCEAGNWTFETPKSHSLVAEWELICDREHLANLTNSIFFIGNLTGCLFCGYLSDTLGRRRVAMTAALLAGLAGLQVAWIHDFYFYVAVRYFLGVSYVGLIALNSYRYELFSSRHRVLGLMCNMSWSASGAVLPWIAYAIPDWRTLCLLLYGFSFVLVVVLYFCPESPPWLIKKGRFSQAYEILRRAAESRGQKLGKGEFMQDVVGIGSKEDTNNNDIDNKRMNEDSDGDRNISENCDDAAKPATLSNESNSFSRLIRSKLVLFPLSVSCVYWSYLTMVYIGVSFSYSNLTGNRFVNFSLLQIIGIPARLAGITICYFFNRRPTIAAGFVAIGVSYLTLAGTRLAVDDVDAAAPLLRIVVSLFVRIFESLTFESFAMWKQEAFPTLIRARSYFIALLVARMASIAASYLSYFEKGAPLTVEATLGVFGVVMSTLVTLMPETMGKPLPQSLQDMKRMRAETKMEGCRILGRRRSVKDVE